MGKIDRRFFLWIAVTGLLSLPFFRWLWKRNGQQQAFRVAGKISTPSFRYGHLLWKLPFKTTASTVSTDYVIIGAGISALSAARALLQQGISRFKILELEPEAGGNSRYAQNAYGKYPLGAHYLPLPSPDMQELIDFLKETGAIEKTTEDGQVFYNEEYLCHAPQERLYIHGIWQNGLVPDFGLPEKDKEEIKRFFEHTEKLKHQKGNDGKFLFDFPLDSSSADAAWRALDRITMQEYLKQQSFHSEFLYWYIDYCCKDDYGTGIDEVSAWAGLHYFCARRGSAANASAHQVLTWPEGNGWLMQRLKDKVRDQLIQRALAYEIKETSSGISVRYLDTNTGQAHELLCKKVMVCCPQFVVKHMRSTIQGLQQRPYNAFHYSSWIVGNLAVKNELKEKGGSSLCWDNVIYQGKSLGFIHSSHQHLNVHQPVINLTYYQLLDEKTFSRKKLLQTHHEELSRLMLEDMQNAYPDLTQSLLRFDPHLWGHAMVKPIPGFIWGEARQKASKPIKDKVYFAHTDLSGISTFEEAFYQGLHAVDQMLYDA